MTNSIQPKLVGGLLALALVVGGAGVNFPLLDMMLGLAALAVAAGLLVVAPSARLSQISVAAVAVLALALVLPLLQLIPLPPGVWSHLPGRALPLEIDAALGVSRWRPLTLDIEGTVRSWLAMLPGAVLFIGALLLPTAERLRLLWIVVAVALFGAALGIVQAATGGLLTIFPSGHKGFATGLFVNRNHQAALLNVAMPIVAGLAAIQIGRGKPAAYWTVAGLSATILLAVGVLGTTSRMGLLILPFAVAASLVLLLYRRSGTKLIVGAVGALAVVAAFIGAAGRFDRVLERFSGLDDSRLTFWTDIRWSLDYYGLWGTGAGTFVPVHRTAESLEAIIPSTINHAHNDFLEILLETGIPGILLVFAFLAIVTVATMRGLSDRARRGRPTVTAMAALGILFILLASLVDYPLRMPAIACVLALLVSILMPSPEPRQAKSREVAIAGSRRGWASPRRLAGFAVIAPLAVLVVQAGVSARLLLDRDPGGAVRWAPWSTAAHRDLASAALARSDLAKALISADKAIALSPISAPAIRTLGLAKLAQRQIETGNRLMQTATVLGWRDPLTQMWAIAAAKAANEPEKAVQRAEALFRQDEMFAPAITQLLAGREAERTVPYLARALAANPSWRRNFFKNAGSLPAGISDGWVRLVVMLGKSNAPVTEAEAAPSIDTLIRRGEVGHAQTMWAALARTTPYLANGQFTERDDNRGRAYPASWYVSKDRRGLVRVEASGSGDGRALHIRGSKRDRLIEQRLLLPPGRYALAFQARSTQPLDVTVEWRLSCEKGSNSRLAFTIPARSGWHEYRAETTVPNQDCAIQKLALRRSGATLPEDIWVDSIRVQRLSD